MWSSVTWWSWISAIAAILAGGIVLAAAFFSALTIFKAKKAGDTFNQDRYLQQLEKQIAEENARKNKLNKQG